MRDTSLEAYRQLNNLSDKQQTVLVYIHGHPDTTDKEIAKGLGWTINRVTPRRGELEAKGLIVGSGYVIQASRRVHCWRLKERK